ncbi:hypothetical protein EB796_011374 [Bugula neritina]|uniref:Integrase zinc-binding domain-containing protein n=1 Tax=Bugula neritina TaxID=10212 RepID=A0A7J7JX78_BUGNE|nr:hypothetical protein EB796_011374 [Bugula neritina]
MPVDPALMDNIKISEIGCVFSVTEEVLPVTAEVIAKYTLSDSTLPGVMKYSRVGWPKHLKEDEESLRPYYSKSNEIGVKRGCILMGLHLVIPEQLRKQILVEIHTDHQRMVKSKAIARSYVWWPGLDKDIEEVCKTCEACQRNKPNPPIAETHPWISAQKPWERIHVDYAGLVEGHMFLIVVDAYVKWPKTLMTSTSTTLVTCNALRGAVCKTWFAKCFGVRQRTMFHISRLQGVHSKLWDNP